MIVVLCAKRFSHAMTRRHWSFPHAHKQPGTYDIENLFLTRTKIYYWCNRHMYHYMHTPTVRYIYHLMSLMDHVFWMNIILTHIYTIVVKSLQNICIMKCPLHPLESTLTRYLMPVHTVIMGFHTITMDTSTSEGYSATLFELIERNKWLVLVCQTHTLVGIGKCIGTHIQMEKNKSKYTLLPNQMLSYVLMETQVVQ